MTYDAAKNSADSYREAIAAKRAKLLMERIPAAKRVEVIGDCELILGDCLEVMPHLEKVDAVVTDPPYGIGFDYNSYDDTIENWEELINKLIPIVKEKSKFAVMPNCRMQAMGWWINNHSPDWIIAWYKGSPGHLSKIGFNDWEPHLCFGKPSKQMHDFFQTPLNIEPNGHPCPKPVAYSKWLVSRSTNPGETVMDCFMGSGTTGVACVNLGRRFIGIELDEGYFNIACDRIRKAYAQPDLFIETAKAPEPKQEPLL